MTAKVVARLSRLSDALADVLRDAEELIAANEFGEPLAELRRVGCELAQLACREFVCDPNPSNEARALSAHIAKQIVAFEARFRPRAVLGRPR